MRDIVVVGVGGHGREMQQCIEDINASGKRWNFIGFVDDATFLSDVNEAPVLGTTAWLKGRDCDVVVALGSPAIRRRVVRSLSALGVVRFATVVHPSAQVGRSVVLGTGCMVSAGAVLTVNINIGDLVLINTAAVVSHDCRLADFATVAPKACLCGGVSLAEGAELGAGCTLVPGVVVGHWSMVGAGSTVTNDVVANATVAGSPNRLLCIREAGWQERV